MALARVKTWVAGEVLTANDLNAEFNNILNNGTSLVQPWVGTFDLDGNVLLLDGDSDTSIDAATDDTITVTVAGANDLQITPNTLTLLSGTNLTIVDGDITHTAGDHAIVSGNLTISDGAVSITDVGNHTNTVSTPLTVIATTSGTPGSSIGTGITLKSQSADETPSDLIALQGHFSDVTAGTEDSTFSIFTRVAGAALARAFAFFSTDSGGSAWFTHANTAARTYTLPNATGTVVVGGAGSGVVATTDLKTATGAASGSLLPSASVNIGLNDYSFSPNLAMTDAGTLSLAVYAISAVDNGSTVPRFTLFNNDGVGGHDYSVRWRYVTASDMPEIWMIVDPVTNLPLHVWASDDPLPNGVATIHVPGYTAVRLTAKDLESLSALSVKASEAADLIRDQKLRMEHQAYRALQLVANDKAPAQWLRENSIMSGGKLEVKRA